MTPLRFNWNPAADASEAEAFNSGRCDRLSVSKATKIVLGTVGVAAVLSLAIVAAIAFG